MIDRKKNVAESSALKKKKPQRKKVVKKKVIKLKKKKDEKPQEQDENKELDAGGRPTKYCEKIVKKLETALKDDFTIEEACNYAGISNKTFYNWCKANPKFLQEMELAKQYVAQKAKKKLAKAIDDGDIDTIKWWLSRRQRDRYATKTETDIYQPEPLTEEEEAEGDEALRLAGIE